MKSSQDSVACNKNFCIYTKMFCDEVVFSKTKKRIRIMVVHDLCANKDNRKR